MLKSLRLQHVLCHGDTFIEFSPGITVIVGSSTSGKSAFIKGLKYVLDSRPLGDSIIQWDEKEAIAELALAQSGNPIVRRSRSIKHGNRYSLNVGKDTYDFKAFGSTVPDEIKDILNFDSINMQTQHEPHFLIFNSPGQVAAYFNRITKLDEIDKIVSDLSSRVRKENAIQDSLKAQLDTNTSKLSTFKNLDLEAFGDNVNEAEVCSHAIIAKNSWSKELSRQIDEIVKVESEQINIPAGTTDLLQAGHDTSCRIEVTDTKIADLKKLIRNIAVIEDISLPDNLPQMVTLSHTIASSIESSNDLIDDILNILARYKFANQANLTTILAKSEMCKSRDELMKQLTVCPTCLTILTEVSKSEVLKGISE